MEILEEEPVYEGIVKLNASLEAQRDQKVPTFDDNKEFSTRESKPSHKDSGIFHMNSSLLDQSDSVLSTDSDQQTPQSMPRHSSVCPVLPQNSGIVIPSTPGYAKRPPVVSQWSRDSGISVHSPTDYEPLDAIPETCSDNDLPSQTGGSKRASMSSRLQSIDEVQRRLVNLRYETMQQEATEMSLREDREQLTMKLDKSVREKEQIEVMFNEKKREVESLKTDKESLNDTLQSKSKELQDLKEKSLIVESDRERLESKCIEYEHEIEKIRYELERVSLQYKDKVEQLEEVQARLHLEQETVKELRGKIFKLEKENVKRLCTPTDEGDKSIEQKLLEEVNELKHKHIEELDELKHEHENEHLRYLGVIVTIVLLAIAVVYVVYHYSDDICSCPYAAYFYFNSSGL